MAAEAKRGRGRPVTPLTDEQRAALDVAEGAADERRRADAAYFDAILAARRAGVPMDQIAKRVGVAPETVRNIIQRRS